MVYFFYPETAYRSLEEMDTIFRKTTSWFNVVSIARTEPQRYDKHGKALVDYEETEEHVHRLAMRQASFGGTMGSEKPGARGVESTGRMDPGYKVENGYGYTGERDSSRES